MLASLEMQFTTDRASHQPAVACHIHYGIVVHRRIQPKRANAPSASRGMCLGNGQTSDTSDSFRDTRKPRSIVAPISDPLDVVEIERRSTVFMRESASGWNVLGALFGVAWPLLKETCGS